MDLGELVPAGVYSCWRVECITQGTSKGWTKDTSPPYLTRGGAMAGASDYRSEIDASRGSAFQSPWHQTNLASSQNLGLDPTDLGEIAWENTWGETVTVRQATITIHA